jgi:hypothetical protein
MTTNGSKLDRRALLKRGVVSAGAAAVATTSISEIVAARRAPALVRHYRQSDQ